ncbi:hypothetical protein CYLTODRAFT_429727 [Cylindrobasidium torrendii FP15055 ss-10]|uniref:G protein-coupled receptor 89 n=1 Tax=Cylindrobasidium torrendii FP15055 ss-10 TaxID=1314674 RepID=A0A0D7BLA3_9AGAR|nr:hypothetical protein CYLTODRAFT_429727 [Cylindrobasidium torrendii FP15055 ss-10]
MWPESALLFGIRGLLFVTSRKYVQGYLYSDLQELSSPSVEDGGEYIELQQSSLPAPTTASTHRSTSQSVIPSTIFSLCFSECCMMFLLLMFQASNAFDSSLACRVRLLNWRISLWTLLTVIILVIPLSSSILLTTGLSISSAEPGRIITPKSLLALVSVAATLVLLSSIPLPAALAPTSFLAAAIARLIVIGTVLLGLLTGFGAMNSIWLHFVAAKPTQPTDRDLDVSVSALARVRDDLAQRKDAYNRRQDPTQNSTWYKRVASSLGGDDDAQEIRGLEALEYQMGLQLEEQRHARDAAKHERTVYGRMFRLTGRIFAVYCVFRSISAIFNLVFPRTRRTASDGYNYPDLAAEIAAYLLALVSSDITFEQISLASRQLGLLFVGFIILSSIRLVLRGVTRALRVTSRNLGASMMVLFLAQLMGLYLLATVVQLRTSFPPAPTAQGENLFATMPAFEVFGSLFDLAYLIAAASHGAVLWGKRTFVEGGGGN